MNRIGGDNATLEAVVQWNTIVRRSVWFAYVQQNWILHAKHTSGDREILIMRCETVRLLLWRRTFWQIKRHSMKVPVVGHPFAALLRALQRNK